MGDPPAAGGRIAFMGVAVIFGATGGVGGALCAQLAADGADVMAVGRDEERLRALTGAVGGGYAVADAMRPETFEAAIMAASARGPIDRFAYCIGSIVLKPLEKTTAEDFMDAFRLNVLGAAAALAGVGPHLRAHGGSAVLFSTVAAQVGFPHHAAIAAAKAGVEGLARSVAAEWAGAARVNVIAPSLTRTPLAAFITKNEAMAKAIAALHPVPRLGEPEDVAALAAFLLGESAGWITGQVISVDGGRAALRHKN